MASLQGSLRWCILVLGLLLVVPAWGQGVEQVFRVDTQGVVRPDGEPQQGDLDEALRLALREALRLAVERLALSETVQQQAAIGVDALTLAELEGLVRYQKTKQPKRRGYCAVHVNAEMDMARVAEWSKRFDGVNPAAKLRIMIVIPEFHIQRKIPDPAGETEMIRRFTDAGYIVLDRQRAEEIRAKDLVKRGLKDDPKALIDIAHQEKADLLLFGEAFSQDVAAPAGLGGRQAARARIEARIYRVDTARLITAADAEAGITDLGDAVAAKAAIREAATKLAGILLNDMLVKGKAALAGCEVFLHRCDYDGARRFSKLLEAIRPGVTGVKLLSFNDTFAVYDIETRMDSAEFAFEVAGRAESDGLPLKVTRVTRGRCDFELLNADREPSPRVEPGKEP